MLHTTVLFMINELYAVGIEFFLIKLRFNTLRIVIKQGSLDIN
jgi:hypothetical protein